jgi:Sulfotransferase domain
MTSSESTVARGATTSTDGVPDFFVVGHAKSGTTALYEMLRAHPQIYMSELKETRFFAPELHPRTKPSKRHPDNLDQYLALFRDAHPGQRRGEASPSYLRPRAAAQRIAELRPDARIIAILREPAGFLRSLHMQLLQAHVETEKDFRRALSLEESRRAEKEHENPLLPQGLLYSEHVHYVEQLRRFHAAFPPEQMLVLIYDDYLADNQGTVRRVLRFLDVDDSPAIEVLHANPSVRLRSPRIYGMVRSIYMGRGPVASTTKKAITTITPRRLRKRALALERRMQWGKPQTADERLMLELRRRFKGEVVALGEYLDRDLVTLWGYDGID